MSPTENPGNGAPATDPAPLDIDRVGPYRTLDVLGRGGMGTVYLAEQTEPVLRRVALKVLDRAKQTDRGVARFEAERQALAQMNHPSIATVYEAGTTEHGVPFFAMEAVVGLPLLAYCDQNRLGLVQRLELFGQVCDAVQHAHQKMVIHRDLKPSNVLVTLDDGRPLCKVIDFGIATGTDRPLVESEALDARAGIPVGTPVFMSPEQIRGDEDVDARADVYALGVLLYQLLAGVLPVDTGGAAPYQVMMRVLDEGMPTPSARFSALDGDRQVEVADRRGSSPRALARQLAGDLDAIVMRAMAGDRHHRYATASDIKADAEHFLRSQPVLAVDATVPYKVRKFVRRNRVSVVSGTVVAIALVAGLVVSTLSMVRARGARDDAVASERRASAAVDYLRKVLASADPGVDGRQVRVVDVLTNASAMVTSDLAGEPEVEASVRETIGLTLLELGVFEEAAPELERAVAIFDAELGPDHPESLHARNSLGRLLYKGGRYGEAAAIHRSVYERQRELLGAESPVTLWAMYNLAKALGRLGAAEEAEALYRDNVALRQRILGSDHPDTLVSINAMSVFLSRQGRHEEAERQQRRNLELLGRVAGADHPDTLRARANLAEILNHQGRYQEAEALVSAGLEAMRAVMGVDHPETLGATAQLALALHHQGRYEKAAALDRDVVAALTRKLGPSHPATVASSVSLGLDLLRLGRLEEAEQWLVQACAAPRTDGRAEPRLALEGLLEICERTGREGEAERYRVLLAEEVDS